MSIWDKDVKDIGASAGKGIFKSAKSIVEKTQKSLRTDSRKSKIIDRIERRLVVKLALEKGLLSRRVSKKYQTDDDLRSTIHKKVSLEDLIKFADSNRVPIRDIKDEIAREIEKEEAKRIIEDESIDEEFKEVYNHIILFKPFSRYKREYMYQAELGQFLRGRFPDTELEVQREASRPDIVVNGIAVEVKGPTTERELQTIADKCLRYPSHFRKGLIIVLFSVSVTSTYYTDWEKGLMDTLRKLGTKVEVIRK